MAMLAAASILPTAPTPPAALMSDYTWLIFGAPGVGKTTLANQFFHPIILATEPGTAAMHAATVEIDSWRKFKQVIAALRTEDHQYRTFVVDTVDNLRALCETYVCGLHGVNDPGEKDDHGLVWRALKREWLSGIHDFRLVPGCSVFVSHERTEPIRQRRGKKMIDTGKYRVTSGLSASGRDVLHGAVDFILHSEIIDGKRWLRTQPVDETTTGNTIIECKGRGGLKESERLPDLVPHSFAELHKAFVAAFGKDE